MKKVTEKVIQYQIRGMLLPINPANNNPIFLELGGKTILPLFTTTDRFAEAAKWCGFGFATANVILNTQDFQDCVLLFKKRFPFHVVIDPHKTPEGNTRFQLAVYDESEQQYLGASDGQES